MPRLPHSFEFFFETLPRNRKSHARDMALGVGQIDHHHDGGQAHQTHSEVLDWFILESQELFSLGRDFKEWCLSRKSDINFNWQPRFPSARASESSPTCRNAPVAGAVVVAPQVCLVVSSCVPNRPELVL